MTEIDYVSTVQYAAGYDPIDWGVHLVAVYLDTRKVAAGRVIAGLPPLPAWIDLSNEAVARKIIARLMDAGWTPPVVGPAVAS